MVFGLSKVRDEIPTAMQDVHDFHGVIEIAKKDHVTETWGTADIGPKLWQRSPERSWQCGEASALIMQPVDKTPTNRSIARLSADMIQNSNQIGDGGVQ